MIRRSSWKLAETSFKTVEAKMNNTLIPTPTPRAVERLTFLFAKASTPDMGDDVLHIFFSNVMDPPKGNDKEFKKFTQASERLDAILPPKDEDGDVTRDKVPVNVQAFSDFLELYPLWMESQSFICQEAKDSLVQRVQKSGLCFLHAPIVLQHYLVAKHRAKCGLSVEEQRKTGMLDMAKYIRGHFKPDQLFQHIFNDKGGSAPIVLDHILQPRSMISPAETGNTDENRLTLYGPHLLAMFQTYDTFAHGNQLSYTSKDLDNGLPQGKLMGLHAMLIVGVRMEDETKVFLLQNWWAKKQFIEMDEAYIKACGGIPMFVETEQTEIPAEFATTLTMYAETTLDLEETYPIEG